MNVYQSICNAMADIEPIAKARENKEQRFKFRGIDEVMNELQPVLKKHGLFVVPKVANVIRQEKPTKSGGMLLYSIVTMEFTMYAQDGTSITGSTVGEGMDSGDKASNKAMAVALKYFLLQTFCIPTEDEKDPDQTSYQVAPPAQKAPAPKQTPADVEKAEKEFFAKFNELNNKLSKYLNTKGLFDRPGVVRQFVAAKDIKNMEAAVAQAEKREAEQKKKEEQKKQAEQEAKPEQLPIF